MNIIQFFFSILMRLNIPIPQNEYEHAQAQLVEQWDSIDIEQPGILAKAKKFLDNPISKLVMAGAALFLGKLIADWFEKKFGDVDNDGDTDPLDAILGILQKHKERQG